MERDDFIDKIIGGIFALIAIGAAVLELCLGGISPATIAACVKDIFGTLTVVIFFVVMIKDKLPAKNFRAAFDSAMEKVSEKYAPLIRKEEIAESDEAPASKAVQAKKKKLNEVICYDMAANLNVLFGISCNDYPRFLEISGDTTTVVKLLIRKKFFDYADFSDTSLNDIAKKIKENLFVKFSMYGYTIDEKKHEILIQMKQKMRTRKDAYELARLIDNVVLLYIAESKK